MNRFDFHLKQQKKNYENVTNSVYFDIFMLSAAIPGHHTESPEFTRCFADFHCPGRKMFEKTNSPPTKLKRRRGIFIGWDLENLAGGGLCM